MTPATIEDVKNLLRLEKHVDSINHTLKFDETEKEESK